MMTSRRAILRGAAILALAVAVVGSTALTPSVSAAPIDSWTDLGAVAAKKTDQKADHEAGQTDNESSQSGGSGLSDIPIIGDVVEQFKNPDPEQIVQTTMELAGAANSALPLIRSFLK